MNVFNGANLKKTFYFLRRNGLRAALNTVRERLEERAGNPYRWEPVGEEELQRQREQVLAGFAPATFSIVTPAYRTPEKHLREMLDSVVAQTYPHWELLLEDATEDDRVESIVRSYREPRIRYRRLTVNGGIAENTNAGISAAEGDFIGLLDHDDLLTENALFEMASEIERSRERKIKLQVIYSDEDKCNDDLTDFYDWNQKEDFNLDLFLGNNYICHFMVMRRELMQELLLRKEYDGAQDFDLLLRAVLRCGAPEKQITHIPLVLYHWRCHASSTSENPQSKRYAYDAGRRAVQDFVDKKGWKARVAEARHLGFYRLEYEADPLETRPELAAVGGPVFSRGRIAGGRMSREGKIFYENLPASYSGPFNRATMQQEAEVLDIRNIEVRKELRSLFPALLGAEYVTLPGTETFDASALPEGTDFAEAGGKLCRALREQGYKLLYMPERGRRLR